MDSDPPLSPTELSSYFKRIEFTPPESPLQHIEGWAARNLAESLPPTLDLVKSIVDAHLRSIAFENLDLHIKKFKPDAEIVEGPMKLLGTRGGWCFDQNGLLKRALLALGYSVEELGCRVCLPTEQDKHDPRPYGHRALLVEVPSLSTVLGMKPTHRTPRKRYLVDVGFGSHSVPWLPIQLPERNEGLSTEVWRVPGVQGWRISSGRYPWATNKEPKDGVGEWERERGNGWYLQYWVLGEPAVEGESAKRRGTWKDAYFFDERTAFFNTDYTAMSHVMSTHHTSPFITATRLSIWSFRSNLDSKLALRKLTVDLDKAGRDPVAEEKGAWLITYLARSVGVRTPEGDLLHLETVVEGGDEMFRAWKDWFGVAF